MEIVKISEWFDNICKVNFSRTQIIRLNHLGKKGVLIGNGYQADSINLYYKNVLFLKLIFDHDYNPDSPKIKLCLPSSFEGVDTIYKMSEARYGLEEKYRALIKKYNPINQRSENTYVIPFDDLEYHVDIFIEAILPLVDHDFDLESYGKEEIKINQALLSDEDGRITGCDAEYKITRRIGNNVFYFGVLEVHEKKCMICNSTNESLIEVCHIKPWSESKNKRHERTDKFNGLTLCRNHHKLFDAGYFTIDERNDVVLSNELDELDLKLFFDDFNSNVFLRNESQYYLEWHRNNIFKDSHLI